MLGRGPLQGHGWRSLRLFILALLLVAGGATAFRLSTLLGERADGMTRYVRVDVWAVQQVEYEIQQFRAVFARHAAGEGDATIENVRKRLAKAQATLPLLQRGPDYQDFRLLVDIDGVTNSTQAALARVETALGATGSYRGDLGTLRLVEESLAGPTDGLRQLAVDLAHVRAELQDGDLANVRWLTGVNSWMLVAFFGIAMTFILILLSETQAARRAEALARQARNRLQEAIECIGEGFVLYDAEDRLVLCNSMFEDMFGDGEGTFVIGSRFEDVLRAVVLRRRIKDTDGSVDEWVQKRLDLHRDPKGPFEQALSNGAHLIVSEQRTHDGGIVGIYTDITELKEREERLGAATSEAEAASRTKSEFLANMSHELRTPLNAIIGFSEMIAGEVLGPTGAPQYKDYAADIKNSGSHLLEIVNDILDVARIETGDIVPNKEEIDLCRITRACSQLLQQRADEADHVLLVGVPDVPYIVFADERSTKQALMNLLSNAIKFTPEGGRISVELETNRNGEVEVVIGDNGIGIAEDDIPKALAFFGQVDSKLARTYEGTGLGLPLARKLIEVQGGRFSLESKPGQGTRVTITFPAESVIDAPLPERAESQAS